MSCRNKDRLVLLRPIITACLCWLILACDSGGQLADPRPVVVVSVAPQAFLIDRLTGGKVNVRTMITTGRSPEEFQPLPQDLAALNGAQYYFAIDLPFEKIWLKKLAEIHPETRIVAIDHDRISQEHDPHHWTNPRNAIELVKVAYPALLKLLPHASDVISANYRSLIEELEILDARIQTLMNEQSARRFLVYHPAWSHFAARYGLEQIAFEQDGKQPGARYLQDLLALCRANSVRAVLVQPQSPPEQLRRFATELGVDQVIIDPLAYDYTDNLWQVAQVIARELW